MNRLAGKHIVVTRAPHQAAELTSALEAEGATPLTYPCIDIAEPVDPTPLDAAIQNLMNNGFDWLVLTSTNAVEALARRKVKVSRELRCAVVGPATAMAAAVQLHCVIRCQSADSRSATLAQAIPLMKGERVFLPQSALAKHDLAEGLETRGAKVTAVDAYRTVRGKGGVALLKRLRESGVDAITLTSGSTVVNLLARLREEGGDDGLLNGVPLACIGHETAAAVLSCRKVAAAVAKTATIAGLVNALVDYFGTPFGTHDVSTPR